MFEKWHVWKMGSLKNGSQSFKQPDGHGRTHSPVINHTIFYSIFDCTRSSLRSNRSASIHFAETKFGFKRVLVVERMTPRIVRPVQFWMEQRTILGNLLLFKFVNWRTVAVNWLSPHFISNFHYYCADADHGSHKNEAYDYNLARRVLTYIYLRCSYLFNFGKKYFAVLPVPDWLYCLVSTLFYNYYFGADF